MFKMVNEEIEELVPRDNTCTNSKENEKQDGKISNEDFFEIQQRILNIMKSLSVTNSFSINSASIIWAQTRLIRDAIETIEQKIREHIEIKEYINK